MPDMTTGDLLQNRLCMIALALALLYLGIPSIPGAQDQPVQFSRLSIDDGLSQNVVNEIIQDYRGFMWFGTKDGLNRYDGNTFIVYQNNPFDTNTVSNNYILSLFEDSDSVLWVGTLQGLNMYQRDNDQFSQFTFSHPDCLELELNQISHIGQDQLGQLWVGTINSGLIKVIKKENRIISYECLNCDSRLNLRRINDIFCDGNFVWVANGAGLLRIDPASMEQLLFPLYTKDPNAINTDVDSSITSIHPAEADYLWLGNHSGLNYFNKQTGDFDHFPHRYTVYRFGWGIIEDIAIDPNGELWLACADELMQFDPVTKTYTSHHHMPHQPFSISGEWIKSVYLDRGGLLWIGTNGFGLNFLKTYGDGFGLLVKDPKVNSRMSGYSVRTIYEDSKGHIWFSSPLLHKWNRKTGEIVTFERSSYEALAMGNTVVWAILEDRHGRMWFGSHEGLYMHVPESGATTHYRHIPGDPESLPEKVVYEIFEDAGGRIWVMTSSFISKFDPASATFESIRYHDTDITSEASFASIHENSEGIFWINTEIGLLRFDPESGRRDLYQNNPLDTTSLNNNTIKALCPDPLAPEDILWLGTAGGGLSRFDRRTGKFEAYTEDDGLPDNVVYGILDDDDGVLWLSTNRGICSFDPKTLEINKFDPADGLQSNEFNSGAAFKSSSGEMFFGGIRGLNYFYPDRLGINPNIPHVVLTALRLGNKRVLPGDSEGILTKAITETQSITLNYNADIVSIEYTALDYAAPHKCHYRYKLEGWDEHWIEAGNTRSATYTNLPPGKYTFRVAGSNSDGLWNQRGTELGIIITPPFWKTHFAYALYAAIILAIIYLIRKYERHRHNLEKQLALEQLEAEKLRELDQFKTTLFANISHEFRTPLTLILGPLQKLRASIGTSQYSGMITSIETNAHRLLRLINEILDLAKLDAGKMQLHLDWKDIAAHARALTMSYKSLAEMEFIQLTFVSVFDNLRARYDADKFEKIVHNLLSNAIKFSGPGDAVTVFLDCESPGKTNEPQIANIHLTVKDTGRGIPEEDQEEIFHRFYRVNHGGRDVSAEGTGIGLALVREFAQLHGGTVNVNSRPGEGSSFAVKLPLLVEQGADRNMLAEEVTANPARRHETARQITDTGTDQHMLIIEDNPDIREFIAMDFSEKFIIHEASDGAYGIELASRLIPDIIITDVMMPGMDGYEVCRRLKETPSTSHIPVIILTARADSAAKLEGLQTGADDYIAKPFDHTELQARVSNLIQVRRALREKFSKEELLIPQPEILNSTDQSFHQKVISLIEDNLDDEQFTIENFSKDMAMSERQLRRKFKALYDLSPNQFLRRARIERARMLIENKAGSIAEIAFKVGFGNPSYFAKCFKERYGVNPSEYLVAE